MHTALWEVLYPQSAANDLHQLRPVNLFGTDRWSMHRTQTQTSLYTHQDGPLQVNPESLT